MTTNIGNLNAFSYSNMASSGSAALNKLYVPVNPSVLMYTHLDHVQGVAAKPGQQGISISKIHILNTLISHVADIKNEPAQTLSDVDDDVIDNLIQNYHDQIQKSMQTPYVLSGAMPQAGELVSIQI